MAERVVLHPAPALIERRVGDAHHVKRVGDLDGVGEHRVEHGPIRADRSSVAQRDPGPPRLGLGGEPAARLNAVATRDDVEQLPESTSTIWVDHRWVRYGALTGEQRLVQPDRRDGPEAVRVVDQRGRRRRRRRPSPCASHSPDRRPPRDTVRPWRPTCTVAHRAARVVIAQPRRGDPRVLLGPRRRTAVGQRHRCLSPHQPGRATEHRQIDQLDLASTVIVRRRAAPGTRRVSLLRIAEIPHCRSPKFPRC